jgi:hypothetical protein
MGRQVRTRFQFTDFRAAGGATPSEFRVDYDKAVQSRGVYKCAKFLLMHDLNDFESQVDNGSEVGPASANWELIVMRTRAARPGRPRDNPIESSRMLITEGSVPSDGMATGTQG